MPDQHLNISINCPIFTRTKAGASFKPHYGTIGGFVYDEDNRLYALTCRHVTKAAENSVIYLKAPDEADDTFIEFGRTLKLAASCNGQQFSQDIDVILIDSAHVSSCDPAFRNKADVILPVSLHSGSTESLFGKPAFVFTNRLNDGEFCVEDSKTSKKSISVQQHNPSSSVAMTTTTTLPVDHAPVQNKESFSTQMHEIGETVTDVIRVQEQTDDLNHCGLQGQIASRSYHEHQKDVLDTELNFLVEFLGAPVLPGDSGSIVAVSRPDGSIELAGLLTGQFEPEAGTPPNQLIQFTLLNKGLEMLGRLYGKKFSLQPHSQQSSNQLAVVPYRDSFLASSTVGPGSRIWVLVKSPDDIKKTDFVLVERIVLLTGCLRQGKHSTDMLQREIETEMKISASLFAREDLANRSSVNIDTPDQKCFLFFMEGANRMYSYDFRHSEKNFKNACRLLIGTRFPNRILCKLIHCASWLLLWTKRYEELGSFLRMTESFASDMEMDEAAPARNLAYYYLNCALFYMKMHCVQGSSEHSPAQTLHQGRPVDFQRAAIVKAWKSYEMFQRFKTSQHQDVEWPGVALTLLAILYLGCGEYFENRDSPVSDEDIDEAERCLKRIRRMNAELPEMKVHYHLALTDLRYRRGDITRALKSARYCKTLSEQLTLENEKERSECRILILSAMLERERDSCAACSHL